MASGIESNIVLILSIVGLFLSVLAIFNLIYNLILLHRYKKRSFFKHRSIKLLIVSIIPSAVEEFILIPFSTVFFGFGIVESTILANVQVLLHTTLLNLWIVYLFIRLWHVFIRIRVYQDSSPWKKVYCETN